MILSQIAIESQYQLDVHMIPNAQLTQHASTKGVKTPVLKATLVHTMPNAESQTTVRYAIVHQAGAETLRDCATNVMLFSYFIVFKILLVF